MEDRSDAPIMMAFLAGALIGAGLGLLFAPRAGKETREQLSELARKARTKAEDLASTMRRKAEEAMPVSSSSSTSRGKGMEA